MIYHYVKKDFEYYILKLTKYIKKIFKKNYVACA
jgi:hypothetical protein